MDLKVEKGNYLPCTGVKAGCQCGKAKNIGLNLL